MGGQIYFIDSVHGLRHLYQKKISALFKYYMKFERKYQPKITTMKKINAFSSETHIYHNRPHTYTQNKRSM